MVATNEWESPTPQMVTTWDKSEGPSKENISRESGRSGYLEFIARPDYVQRSIGVEVAAHKIARRFASRRSDGIIGIDGSKLRFTAGGKNGSVDMPGRAVVRSVVHADA